MSVNSILPSGKHRARWLTMRTKQTRERRTRILLYIYIYIFKPHINNSSITSSSVILFCFLTSTNKYSTTDNKQ